MPDLLCSVWSKSNGVDPIGSAGSYTGFVVIDWPLPWPKDASDIPALAPVAAAAAAAGARLQLTVPGERDMTVGFWQWEEQAGRYRGREAPAGSGAATAMTFIEGGDPDGARPVAVTDVLVCGHGKRDRCCGSLGTSLAIELTAAGLGGSVRVRRTSHTGGHRFAPTAIVLPEGTCWGYLDADSIAMIVGRTGPVEQAVTHYRGCLGLGGPEVQAVEKEVLRVLGWDLLDQPRRATVEPDGRTGLEVSFPEGKRKWTATVGPGRVLPVPVCGAPLEMAAKTQAEMTVADLAETA